MSKFFTSFLYKFSDNFVKEILGNRVIIHEVIREVIREVIQCQRNPRKPGYSAFSFSVNRFLFFIFTFSSFSAYKTGGNEDFGENLKNDRGV